MNLIDERFERLKKEGKKAFIGYVTFGYPSFEETLEVIKLVYSYVDILEIGFPFSDPIADGEIIQKASIKALSEGVKLSHLFESIEKFKKDKPVVLMLYANTVYKRGIDRFFESSKACGVDGVIIPDVSFEESFEFKEAAEKFGVTYIDLVSISSLERAKMIGKQSKGFLYCVSRKGVTGFKGQIDDRIFTFLRELKTVTPTPLAVGFGIKGKEDVQKFKDLADGIVIGSAIITKIDEGKDKLEDFLKEISESLKDK
ncbi:tryptophan synthase, alpha subunit [Caldicellulosiruptor acetigenus I77R1B]|uniref:Tryptophan synthase alpha chain n=1 Tax=Caldicellulosiruptor acetigenus (strain ATCC 700853 / DSM 12137 / I77R1B) TaxID=632335 RepID=E4SAG9_CALA7|nr:tryptophan synthase subunit alpha [Caldicellulosiruptor acetigenus]ADQ41194.1 tryptophan synthase, alpha subunit [Caldicellulosiruptor acetigenus I77R1B]